MPSVKTVKCEVCGKEAFDLAQHLEDAHKLSVTNYQKRYPNAPVVAPELAAAVQAAKRIRVPHTTAQPLADLVVNERDEAKLIKDGLAIQIPGTSRVLSMDPNNTVHPVVDPLYETPDEMDKFAWAWQHRKNTYVYGETGLGKSHMVKQLAGLTRTRLWSVNGHGDALVADLYGYNQIENGDSHFMWGALPNSMVKGEPLLIEEIDRLPPRVTTGLHNAISDGELYLTESGETVKAKPGWCVLATANTRGQGDTTGRYGSAEVVDSALIRRFKTRIEMQSLTDAQLRKLVMAKVPQFSQENAKKLVNLGKALATSSANELFMPFGTADLLNLAEHLLEWEPKEAVCLAFANVLMDEDRAAVVNNTETHLGKVKMTF